MEFTAGDELFEVVSADVGCEVEAWVVDEDTEVRVGVVMEILVDAEVAVP